MTERSLRKIAVFLFLVTLGLGSFFIMGSRQVEATDPTTSYYDQVRLDNKTYPVRIPDTLTFSGEAVPISDPDVRQRLDRELLVNTYWQSQTLLILKEYNQVIALIEPILKKYNIPHDFVYLCVAESGLQYNAVSQSGAVGLWQFMEGTGEHYGLQIDDEVDERLGYEQSTEAACKYLLDAKEKFGSWTLAAAAYNMGMDATQNVIDKQKVDDYYNLYLNRETSRYIYRILALKEILEHPAEYGFVLNADDEYGPYKYYTVNVDSSVNDWVAFAKQHNTNYKSLKVLNPWITSYTLTNHSQKDYELKLPYSD